MRHRLVYLLSTFSLVLVGCSNGGDASFGAAPPASTCTVEEQNVEIETTMEQWYLEYMQLVEGLDPGGFATPDDFLDALVADVDFVPGLPVQEDRYSFVITEEEERQLINAASVAFGFSFRIVNVDEVQLAQVLGEYPQETLSTPASRGGLQRGYFILEIEGIPVADIIADNPNEPVQAISDALGPRIEGVTRNLTVEDLGGAVEEVQLVKEEIAFNTVPIFEVFDVDGVPVGYFNFRTFANPSFQELSDAFAVFNAAGVEDVIIDLRYNGGGLVSVAEFLGNLLGGDIATSEIFSATVYNDQNANRNTSAVFVPENETLPNLNSLIFITTVASASASELVLNSMLPYVDVKIVGATTFGKPVGSLGFSICGDLVLRPATFQTVNADGEGDYFDGFTPNCPADDNLDFLLGDPNEDSLNAALTIISTGLCPVVAEAKGEQLEEKQSALREQFRQREPQRVELDIY